MLHSVWQLLSLMRLNSWWGKLKKTSINVITLLLLSSFVANNRASWDFYIQNFHTIILVNHLKYPLPPAILFFTIIIIDDEQTDSSWWLDKLHCWNERNWIVSLFSLYQGNLHLKKQHQYKQSVPANRKPNSDI